MSESNTETNGLPCWAVVELMGHRRLIGYVSEITIAGAPMLRINVLMADGEATQFYGAGSIYCLTPTTEETARRAASLNTVAPITMWELPTPKVPERVAMAAVGFHEDAELDGNEDHYDDE